jgi:ATP-dependent Zn protease
MDRYYRKAKKLIVENRAFLDRLASELMEKKVITYKTVKKLKEAC